MYITALEQDQKQFQKKLKRGKAFAPVFIKIKLLWDCNLKCKMCNHWRWRGPMLPQKDLKNLIPELAKMGCQRIHLSGGEPLMYPELPYFINKMRKNKIKITMTSNATLITQEKAEELVQAGLNKANISIDSPVAETHDEIRGMKGAFERTLRGIQYLKNAFEEKAKQNDSSEGKMFLNMVVNQSNYQQVHQLPELVAKSGMRGFHLIPIFARNEELKHLSTPQIKEFNDSIAPVIFEKSQSLDLEVEPSDIWIFGRTEEEIQSSAQGNYAHTYYQQNPCYALWTHALIDHQGNVAPCCTLTEQIIIGNIQEQSFQKIWEGKKFKELRKAHLPIHESCNRCTMFLPKNQRITELLR